MTHEHEFTDDNQAWLELQAPMIPWTTPAPLQVAFVADVDDESADFTVSNQDWLNLQTPMVPWGVFGAS